MFTLQNCDANPITTSHLGNNHYSNVIFPSPLIHLPAKSWLTLENNVPWCSRKSIEICHTKLEPLSHEERSANEFSACLPVMFLNFQFCSETLEKKLYFNLFILSKEIKKYLFFCEK